MRCIPKGDEITHIYQGHFGDTPKEKRQDILDRMFHFKCLCSACVNDYPLANKLPHTYSEMGKLLYDDETAASYYQAIEDKMEKYNFDFKNLKSTTTFKDMLLAEITSIRVPDNQKIINILKILDEYHTAMNDDLVVLIENKNIDGALELYYERQKIASIFLHPPHMMFLSGRAAITDCLWVKYGNKAYGTSGTELFGTYM